MKTKPSSPMTSLTSKKALLEQTRRTVSNDIYATWSKINSLTARLRDIEGNLQILDAEKLNTLETIHHFNMLISLIKSEITKLETLKQNYVLTLKSTSEALLKLKK